MLRDSTRRGDVARGAQRGGEESDLAVSLTLAYLLEILTELLTLRNYLAVLGQFLRWSSAM